MNLNLITQLNKNEFVRGIPKKYLLKKIKFVKHAK